MDYPQALDWLYGTQLTGIKLGLDNMRRLTTAIGGQGTAKFLHVAGTNGKGSVCAMADAVSRAAGRRTGLFTSPHLLTFRERMTLNGALISESGVADGLTRLRDLTADWDPAPTFFELTAALALDWFAREGVEVIVWETGLGGRLDATNVVAPAACGITAIDFDHRAWLGDTLTEIAGEKAGIIKPGVPVVSGPQTAEARDVLVRAADERGAALRFVEAPLPGDWTLNLPGSHQRVNAALALALLDAAGVAADEPARRAGLAAVDWPGRFQRLENGKFILDGAHNPAAAARLAQTWAEEFGPDGIGEVTKAEEVESREMTKATVVLGILRDKEADAICRALAPLAARFITVTARSPRARRAEELRDLLAEAAPEVRCVCAMSLAAALDLAREKPESALVTGSLFLVGEALGLLTGQIGDSQMSAQ